MRPVTAATILTIAASSLTVTTASLAASFDCDRKDLAADERAICDNRALNDLDVKMATSFELIAGLLAMGNRGELQDQQSAWLKKRQACEGDTLCLRNAYDERMKQLEDTYNNLGRPL
ncbi:hypothetical protein NBH20_01875 [Rhizobium sp. S153]|uniref:Lysozyme inhibitor LprI N-terminal domain-containing protein n=1 Tax=Ciceribacter sichuanensis TaxID=2949647 RepID=A0ABT0V286_9HYPH|nr:hypothetical protein [Ciceribacter sp. S153]MCM2399889.1 hypothetical protein [Ciceribacter sp. S153]